ncbi:hypothetical protein I553_2233 [Mycobacterium xenopi 4042]|uniref:Uncharacterized protein n=1 Tax=Mycobacterium xenopi 4042 TaxID=1299334 RepID=X8DNI8_MYCXE|nr:hypothetical protein I553_2233 [Mycobacterium xenopi 4042]
MSRAGSCHTGAMSRHRVELLTRAGCLICARMHERLTELADELGFDLAATDVDAAAAAGNPGCAPSSATACR